MSDLSPLMGEQRTSLNIPTPVPTNAPSQDFRAKCDSKLTYLTAWIASFVRVPFR